MWSDNVVHTVHVWIDTFLHFPSLIKGNNTTADSCTFHSASNGVAVPCLRGWLYQQSDLDLQMSISSKGPKQHNTLRLVHKARPT